MIAASTLVSRASGQYRQPASKAGTGPKTGWHFYPVPDVNRSLHQRIGKSGAGWTFATITRLIHHVGRVGRPQARKAARAEQRIGVGLAAVAAEAGLSIGKVRADVRKLEAIGVIVVHRPNVMSVRNPETGKIVSNRTGRSKATVMYLTITESHVRQAAGQAAVSPPNRAGLPATDRDNPCRAIQREEKTKRRPDGLAAGVGQPPATAALEGGLAAAGTGTTGTPTGLPDSHQGRLTAAEAGGGLTAATGAGRLTAAVSGRESDPIVPRDAGRDEPPPGLPANRLLPAPKAAPPDPEAAAKQAVRERLLRRVADFAYHLGIDQASVIELGRSDPDELRRRLVSAGIDPATGKPVKAAWHERQPDDHATEAANRAAWYRAAAEAAR